MATLKILLVITELPLGGAQKHVLGIAEHLSRDAFDVFLAAGPHGALQKDAERLKDTHHICIKHLVRPIHPLKDLRAFLALYQLCKREHFDIVHTHSSKAGIIGRWAARAARVSSIVHTAHGWGFYRSDGRRVKQGLLWIERWTACITDRLIAVSQQTLDEGLKHRVGSRAQYQLIHHGVDPRPFQSTGTNTAVLKDIQGIEPGSAIISMIACLKPQKTPLDFLEVARLVNARVPETHFLMIGDGVLRANVETALQRTQLKDQVHLLGWRRDIPALLARTDILVQTSRWEGLPGALLEGLAAGIPVVAYAVGGVPEIVTDGVNGFLAGAGDVQTMAKRIVELLTNPSTREHIKAGARSCFEAQFDIRDMVRRLEEMYVQTAPVPAFSTARALIVSTHPDLSLSPTQPSSATHPGAIQAESITANMWAWFRRARRTATAVTFLVPRTTLRTLDTRTLIFVVLSRLYAGKRTYLMDSAGQQSEVSRWKAVRIIFRVVFVNVTEGLLIVLRTRRASQGLRAGKAPTPVHPSNSTQDFALKIGYFVTDCWSGAHRKGGSLTHISGVSRAMVDLGHDVFFLSCCPLDLIHRLPFRGHEILPSGSMLVPELVELRHNRRLAAEARPLLEKEQPSLLYQRYSRNVFAVAQLAAERKIPFILEYNAPITWETRHWGRRPLLPGLTDQVELSVLRAASRIIVVSHALEDLLLAKGIPRERLVVLPNGVDVESFNPDISPLVIRRQLGLGSKIVIGFSGSFQHWHGADLLARSARLVSDTEDNVRFVFIGDGPRADQTRASATHAGLDNGIIFTGAIPHEEVPSYLAACDILVNPLLPNPDGTPFFGSPIKLFEYMAMGRPIVASRLGQLTDVLTDEEDALLVEPGDGRALADAMVRLARDEALRNRLGRNARRAAVERHTWKENVTQLLSNLGEASP